MRRSTCSSTPTGASTVRADLPTFPHAAPSSARPSLLLLLLLTTLAAALADVKVDSCGGDAAMSADGVWQQYAMYRDALNASGRQVYFQMCNTLHYDDAFPELRGGGGFSATMRPWAAQGRDVRTLANGVFIQCELLGIPGPTRIKPNSLWCVLPGIVCG